MGEPAASPAHVGLTDPTAWPPAWARGDTDEGLTARGVKSVCSGIGGFKFQVCRAAHGGTQGSQHRAGHIWDAPKSCAQSALDLPELFSSRGGRPPAGAGRCAAQRLRGKKTRQKVFGIVPRAAQVGGGRRLLTTGGVGKARDSEEVSWSTEGAQNTGLLGEPRLGGRRRRGGEDRV